MLSTINRVFALFMILAIAVVVSIPPVSLSGSKICLGTGELKVVYATKDGVEHIIGEEEMSANIFSLVQRIQDAELREELLELCNEQFYIPRDNEERYFFVMPSEIEIQMRDKGWMGVTYEDPRPGCITLWLNEKSLVYPQQVQNPEGMALLSETSLVHELNHIRDWKAGRLDALIEYKEAALAGLVETELPYNTAMRSRVEMLITELRAVDLECRYIQDYCQEAWFADVLPAEPVGRDIYLAWQNGQADIYCSLVYDEYEKLFFPENWAIDESNSAEMKTWMIFEARREY